MARGKKNENVLTPEEKLVQALVPDWEKPYKVPKNWCFFYFTSLIDIEGGTQPPKSQFIEEPRDGYVRLIQIRDFATDKYTVYVPDTPKMRHLEKKDILIARYGASLGRICTGQQGVYNVALAKTMFFESVLYRKYVYWMLQSETFQNPLTQLSRIAQAGFNKDDLSGFAMPLAPLSEQKRIVDRIERLFAKLDEAYEKAQEVVDKFGTRKLSILSKAFSGEYTSEWRNSHAPSPVGVADACRHTAQQWTKKEQRLLAAEQDKICFESKENGHMWMVCTIGAVARISNGSTPSRTVDAYWNGDIPWVSSGEVKNNIICETSEKITQAGYENTSVKLLPVGTVLIAMIGEGKTRGQSAILQIPATTNQNVAAIIIDSHHIESKYLWYWLQMNYAKNREIGGGSGPQALNCQRVRELDFKLPLIAEQVEIVRILDSLFTKEQQAKEAAEAVLEKIDLLKKSILARAFRGELGTNDPTEESALELLKQVLR